MQPPRHSAAAVELPPEEFRQIGRWLVDRLADFLENMPGGRVTPAEAPADVRNAIGAGRPLPESGEAADAVVKHAAELLIEHSLFNGHPRFYGYVTSSAMPLGALADLLASAINSNVGAWKLAPAATEIEAQTIRWISELIGYRTGCGGILVSGGNMANMAAFYAARTFAGGPQLRAQGVTAVPPLRCYCSRETHTWIQKAADLSGLGTGSVRWIDCDGAQRIDLTALRTAIEADRARGDLPFLVVGNAGTVSTGAVDPIDELAVLCREQRIWFHVDGAYGGLAGGVPGAPEGLRALALADSVAVDPHKWLYAPLEAGCVLVRDPELLRNAFSYRPSYYNFDTDGINYYDYGPQNSRGFRALKIWLALQQAGRNGFHQTISQDIALAEHAFRLFDAHPDFEAVTRNLSICTFRYVPTELRATRPSDLREQALNRLNESLLGAIENSGEAFLSNAVVNGAWLLRMCIVNFRTTAADIEALPDMIAALGEREFAKMQHAAAR